MLSVCIHQQISNSLGETYAAIDLHSSEDVAIKVEKLDNKKMVLKLEVIALKKLQGN